MLAGSKSRTMSPSDRTAKEHIMNEELESPVLYANQAQLHVGVYDFTLEFGRVEDGRKSPPRISPVARIQMSPQHTKVVALLLLKHVAAYEHQVGVIELPSALLADLKLSNLEHFISQVNLNE
jgi:hypothetical protein